VLEPMQVQGGADDSLREENQRLLRDNEQLQGGSICTASCNPSNESHIITLFPPLSQNLRSSCTMTTKTTAQHSQRKRRS
jgi:hypothetical protein